MLSGRVAWRKRIRPDALAQANNCCSRCGAGEGQLSCHERWEYDDKQSTATLLGFEIRCSNCHLVAHAGRAKALGKEEVAIAHLCAVNGWKRERAAAILREARSVWSTRSMREWRITVTPSLLNQYPELAALPEFVARPIAY